MILSGLERELERCLIIQRLINLYYYFIADWKGGKMNKTPIKNKEESLVQDFKGEDFLREIITKQFINNLKLEISQKVKPSKSILEALKHSNAINQNYKKSIEQLNSKLEVMGIYNEQLKKRIVELQQMVKQKDNINNSLLYSASLKRQESQRIEQQKNKENLQANHEYLIEIQMLKEKIRHLEEYKALKQIRFNEIIEKQAQYVGQINLLKYKNESLLSNIKTLQQTLHNLKTKQEPLSIEQKLTRKKSEASQRFNSYINQQDSFKSDDSIQEMKEIQYLIKPKENSNIVNNNSLLVSCTMAVDIEEAYNIDSVENTKKQTESFNEIDLMISEEMPNFKTNSVIDSQQVRENVNSSIIVININPS